MDPSWGTGEVPQKIYRLSSPAGRLEQAAALAMEAQPDGVPCGLKGFSAIAEAGYTVTNFNCQKCENSCAISAMTTDTGGKLYYGSRCDLFDAGITAKRGKEETPFNQREELLFAGYDPAKGTGPLVGVPRALMSYDLAPLFTLHAFRPRKGPHRRVGR